MASYEASTVTRAGPEAAWSAWTDVAGWSAFEHIASASIDGEFRVGARITSKAKGFPSSSLMVTRADRPRVWVDEARSPGMRMTFEHLIEPVAEGTRLTERVSIGGALGAAFAPLIRRRLTALFAASVASVARQAEESEAGGG
jgi:Polyketide cyclase / dehydrase and lipid transport